MVGGQYDGGNFTNSHQQGWEKWVNIKLFIYGTTAIIVTAMNLLIVILFCVRPTLRKKIPNILLLNQALADLYNAVVTMPTWVIVNYLSINHVNDLDDLLTFKFFVNFFSVFISLGSFLATAADRSFSVTEPLIHRRVMTKGRVKIVLLLIWISSVGHSL